MTGHPNRSKANRNAKANPTPTEIRTARETAGLTQTQAAELIYSNLRSWQNWENESAVDGRRMHPGLFELFLIKTGQRQIYTDSEPQMGQAEPVPVRDLMPRGTGFTSAEAGMIEAAVKKIGPIGPRIKRRGE